MKHLYSALCIVVHPKCFTIMWGGLSSTTTTVQHPLGWCDGCHRTTAPVRSPHTSYRWRGERVIETIKWMYCDILKQSMIPSLRRLGRRAVFQHDNDPKHTSKTTTALLKKLRVKVICGASSNRRWRNTRSLTSTSSVMSSWRSVRGLQCQPVKLWWTSCPRGLRQCWKIMVATQNIDTLGPIWTFSLRGVLTFVASGLDINGCVWSYFEGTANLWRNYAFI